MEQIPQCLMLRCKVKRQAWLDWIWGHLCSGNILATRTVLVEVLWSWQFRAVHANAEEAQAAISQQPLFAPRNEALQDNEHFKTAIPTTPTTRLSQHSDIGWHRERGRRGKEQACQLDLSKPHFLFWVVGRIHPICSNNTDYTTNIRLCTLQSTSFSCVYTKWPFNSISVLHLSV